MSKKLLVVGWYGAGNLGDELILASICKWSAELSTTVTATSVDPAYTTKTHGIGSVDLFEINALVHAVRSADYVLIGGGGLFQTHQEFTYEGLFDATKNDIASYLRPAVLAFQFGKPVIMWAQGVGPLDTHESRKIIAEVFGTVDSITVRDQGSAELLRAAGCNKEIIVGADPVWAMPLPVTSAMTLASPARLRIALVIRPWDFVPDWPNRLIEAIRTSFVANDVELIWLPFQTHEVPNRSGSDVPFIKGMMQQLGEYSQELCIGKNIAQCVEVLQSCDRVVAMRLHAQVLAFRFGKPTLCIEYDQKMSVQSELVALVDDKRLRLDDSQKRWNHAFSALTLTAESGLLSERLPELFDSALHHRDALHQFLMTEVRQTNALAAENWMSVWREQKMLGMLSEMQSAFSFSMREQTVRISALQAELMELAQKNELRLKEIAECKLDNASLIAEKQNLSNQLTVQEHENALLKDRVAEQIVAVNEYSAYKKTFGYRLQKKMRKIVKFAYRGIKAIYWMLPQVVRNVLHGPRHKFVRFVRGLPAPEVTLSEAASDLPWVRFQDEVLKARIYKGIFVQELVIDWNVPLYQRPQHISTALGQLGYLVIYRTDNWAGDDVEGFREVEPNVWITNRHEISSLHGVARSFYSTAYANTPELIMENGKRGLLVYEYIDHIDPQISGDAENIKRLLRLKEFAVGGGADFIIASAKRLYDEMAQFVPHEKLLLVPNGVDTKHYRDPKHEQYKLPEELVLFHENHPNIVGYFGALAPWLWYSIIRDLALLRPDLGFVFIGPDYYGGVSNLPKLDNVLYLGTVDYKVLPAYAKLFSICFIPFSPGEIAKTTSPLKLFEYFALEKPVVVTSDMLECVSFSEVLHGDDVNTLSIAFDKALELKDRPEFKARLAFLADQNSWAERARSMEVIFNREIK
ncbi:polysaccharide pyruvyl transferase family protein [Jeongeupia chitinilytica]|uniref:Polysaccharide pyruvyl transferase domain-containing protein n=1 Tax=Jeongeupia chitinilytica TaxID=1041641 RepID=A0ABQ3H2S8_9NEIS|nr:polysaccharide pyruvyl transferase family protein [Jeongeupia chitinilytica]GHD67438.1 hypothetical protein GCM10007350_31120 [Jeongeupia chitinilytica]